ncbi:androgen-dependent TFPI-regulating protein-like isoform X1 [Maniola jurtina]|uniref:androgen-dependent TFPI-regulating protein-like isoform X1 n=1 Tax=Maniola jurtina TaxID=191418 RepID=UPI001E686F69|nr:androgen-dependent TFPI-regulating protein-like isoform X1 [Maniola jurtina]
MEELWKDSNIFYNVLCFLITENEKLFDRSDAVLYWRTVYHLFGILHHVYIGLFAMGLKIETHPNPDIRVLSTLGPGYLTGWNFTFQTVFLGLSLLHDVLEWCDKQKSSLGAKIKYWRDVIFCGMVLPFTLFVTGMFWTVYAIDRELVFPKIYDEVVPWWFNHCVHTNITVVLVVETLLQARRHPTNQRLELILYWIVAFAYAIVYYTIYFVTDRWLYQVFGVMNWWQVCLYQLFIWGISYFFYKMQFPLNRLIHGSDTETDNNEEKHINDVFHDNDRQTDVLNPDENGKVNTDLETNLPEKSWSMKFRNIKNNVENSRL